LISPDSGHGKTGVLEFLRQVNLHEAKLTKNITPPAIYRRLERRPRTLYLLDEAENLCLTTDPLLRAVIDAGYERGGTIDRADGEFPVFFPCAFAYRGLESDLPLAIRSRSFMIHMAKRVPKERFSDDPKSLTNWLFFANSLNNGRRMPHLIPTLKFRPS
jgi:hypothetical protein